MKQFQMQNQKAIQSNTNHQFGDRLMGYILNRFEHIWEGEGGPCMVSVRVSHLIPAH